jgi:hypothetical protein
MCDPGTRQLVLTKKRGAQVQNLEVLSTNDSVAAQVQVSFETIVERRNSGRVLFVTVV